MRTTKQLAREAAEACCGTLAVGVDLLALAASMLNFRVTVVV